MGNVLPFHNAKKDLNGMGELAVKELAGAGSIYVHLKRPSNVSDNSTDLVKLLQYSIITLSTSHHDDNNGNVSPTLPVISNHYATSYTSPTLIDDQLQETPLQLTTLLQRMSIRVDM